MSDPAIPIQRNSLLARLPAVLPLTHEFLAMMLGVRRPGVTVAVGALEKAGIIDNRRGRVVIRDLERLEEAACECYRLIKSDADRLVGR